MIGALAHELMKSNDIEYMLQMRVYIHRNGREITPRDYRVVLVYLRDY
jgi:hypothetical protein